MTHKGSCHCGRIAFEVEGDIAQVMECNCSHCSRKGYLLWFVPRESLRLATPESALATYMFNKKRRVVLRASEISGLSAARSAENPHGHRVS